MLRAIEKALNAVTTPVSRLLRHIGGILLLIMTVVVVTQVVFRYVLNIPLSWTDEVSRFLMIYMTYLCLPFVYLTDKNIAMTFVTEALEKKMPRVFSFFALLAHISAALVFGVWIKFGWNFFNTGSVMADSLPIPMFYVYIIPPVMMSVTLLYVLQKAIASIRGILGDFEDVSHTAKTAEMLENPSFEENSGEEEAQPLQPTTAA